jgi:DNA invertase Pin-like site-specific DNA recombinase
MTLPSARSSLQPPLTPRNGHTLVTLGIARISTEHQDQRSLLDQEALYRSWLNEHAGGPFQLEMIAGRGSGERLDREEARQARAAVKTGRFDLVIAEDLGRIFRRVHALLYCELCEDNETRLIALNDQVDTAQPNWHLLAGFAAMRHEMYNEDTSKRIRRSQRNRFQQGGVVQTVVFGYLKPPGAKTDGELQKDPAAEPVYAEIFRRLEGGAGYSEVADWLNGEGVKPGPYARSPRWNCSLVTQLVHNPILKGVRVRNRKMSKRVNETGLRKSVPAPPSELLARSVPHLAFIDPARYDRLIRDLDERNARFRRKGVGGVDPRRNVPKKRTVWPGQHIDCGICGRPYVYGGHGLKDHLMCRGAHDYRCWNAFTVDGPLAAGKLIAAIRRSIEALPDFDPALRQLVEEELTRCREHQEPRRQELERRRAALERRLANVVAAIGQMGHSDSLLEELTRVEQDKAAVLEEQQELSRSADDLQRSELPPMADIKALAARAFDDLAVSSPEFGRLLRRLIVRIVVYPYRLCDGGRPVLRARFSFCLAPLLTSVQASGAADGALRRSLEVDLFDPPQRAAHRARVLELTANGVTQPEIGRELGIALPTVQRAVALARRMAELQIADPYLPLGAPPEDFEQLQRHRHPRYRFEPLPPAAPGEEPAAS